MLNPATLKISTKIRSACVRIVLYCISGTSCMAGWVGHSPATVLIHCALSLCSLTALSLCSLLSALYSLCPLLSAFSLSQLCLSFSFSHFSFGDLCRLYTLCPFGSLCPLCFLCSLLPMLSALCSTLSLSICSLSLFRVCFLCSTVSGAGVRTVVLTRAMAGSSADYFSLTQAGLLSGIDVNSALGIPPAVMRVPVLAVLVLCCFCRVAVVPLLS